MRSSVVARSHIAPRQKAEDCRLRSADHARRTQREERNWRWSRKEERSRRQGRGFSAGEIAGASSTGRELVAAADVGAERGERRRRPAAGDGGSGDEAKDRIRGVEQALEPKNLQRDLQGCCSWAQMQACVPRSGVCTRSRRKPRGQGCDGRAKLSYSSLKDKDTGIGMGRGSAVGASDLGAEVAPA